MVTPTATNVLYFRGRSGRIYTVNAYVSDVIGANVLFNLNGAAGAASDTYIRLPEPAVLYDASIITGPTVATGMTFTQDGAVIAGSAVLLAAQLNTLATRGALAVAFPAGALIGAKQF